MATNIVIPLGRRTLVFNQRTGDVHWGIQTVRRGYDGPVDPGIMNRLRAVRGCDQLRELPRDATTWETYRSLIAGKRDRDPATRQIFTGLWKIHDGIAAMRGDIDALRAVSRESTRSAEPRRHDDARPWYDLRRAFARLREELLWNRMYTAPLALPRLRPRYHLDARGGIVGQGVRGVLQPDYDP